MAWQTIKILRSDIPKIEKGDILMIKEDSKDITENRLSHSITIENQRTGEMWEGLGILKHLVWQNLD